MRNLTLLFISLLLWTSSCASIDQQPQTVEQMYDTAIQHYDRGFYTQAIEVFKKVITQNPGTRYATFGYLKMADAQLALGSNQYRDSEMNYRVFLSLNHNSHLVPYVLEKLITLNFKRNEQWLFGTYYDYQRDPKPFKQIITEYQRFYLLYPNSLYLKTSKKYLKKSIEALAKHELMIGDWYYQYQLYPSAIARYVYLLRKYPNFSNTKVVVQKLIKTYKKNQQPQLATELERVYQEKFTKG
ncbi:MAG: outer membrane protein assembly factor BamD [bacterium]|jgi:outer membrane protein assembly factor BamD